MKLPSSVTKELGQHRSLPDYFTSISSSREATVTDSCVNRHSVGRLCNRLTGWLKEFYSRNFLSN